jgi:hypothetical protein
MAKGTTTYAGIRGALLAVVVEAGSNIKAGDAVEAALARHPLAGKTPKATCHARLGEMVKAGLIRRPKPGFYAATAKGRKEVQV